MTRVYEEIVEFIAHGSTPGDVASFEPSEQSREYVLGLIQRSKDGVLNTDEQSELDLYLQLEHVMRLAKAKARAHLGRDAGTLGDRP